MTIVLTLNHQKCVRLKVFVTSNTTAPNVKRPVANVIMTKMYVQTKLKIALFNPFVMTYVLIE